MLKPAIRALIVVTAFATPCISFAAQFGPAAPPAGPSWKDSKLGPAAPPAGPSWKDSKMGPAAPPAGPSWKDSK